MIFERETGFGKHGLLHMLAVSVCSPKASPRRNTVRNRLLSVPVSPRSNAGQARGGKKSPGEYADIVNAARLRLTLGRSVVSPGMGGCFHHGNAIPDNGRTFQIGQIKFDFVNSNIFPGFRNDNSKTRGKQIVFQ